MAVGISREVAGRCVALALASTSLAFGTAALVLAVLFVLLRTVNSPGDPTWPALLCLVPLAALMMVHRRSERPLWLLLLHLVVGVAGIGGYAAVMIAGAPDATVESPFLLALPQLALIYTIAPTVFGVRSVVFIVLAYLGGQGAVLLAATAVGRYPAFDLFTGAGALAIVAIAVANFMITRRATADQRAVDRAQREADAIAYQHELETQVVALFHDTVLSELTVLATRAPGPLTAEQRDSLRAGLELVERGDWWPGEASEAAAPGRAPGGLLPPAVTLALEAGRAEGVDVSLHGDLASLHRLTPETGAALGLALAQVLVNTGRHSGAAHAELTVDGAPDAIAVMVSDAGSGFDGAAVPADRLGVSGSILGRIRDAGGEAHLYTAPGSGTAYLFRLPAAAAHRWPASADEPAALGVEVGVGVGVGDGLGVGTGFGSGFGVGAPDPQHAVADSAERRPTRRTPRERVAGFLHWRGTPQRFDPVVIRGLYPLIWFAMMVTVVASIARTVLGAAEISVPLLAVLALGLLVVAVIAVLVVTDPVRSVARPGGFVLAMLAVNLAAAASTVSTWATSNVIWDNWGQFAVAVVLVAFSEFRPGRELAAAALISALAVGGLVAIETTMMPEVASPLTTGLIAATPVVLFGIAATMFSYRMSLLLSRSLERSAREQGGLTRRVRIRLRAMLREAGRELVPAELVPLLRDVLVRGEASEDDRRRARRISAVLRSVLITEMGLPWLERMRRRHEGLLEVDDARAAESLSMEQKVALRTLLTALLGSVRADPAPPAEAQGGASARRVVQIRVSRRDEHRSVFVRVPFTGGEAAMRRLFGTDLTVMNAVFGRSNVTLADGELRLLFADDADERRLSLRR